MSWRDFWQTTIANLRTLFGGQAAPSRTHEAQARPGPAASSTGWHTLIPTGRSQPRRGAGVEDSLLPPGVEVIDVAPTPQPAVATVKQQEAMADAEPAEDALLPGGEPARAEPLDAAPAAVAPEESGPGAPAAAGAPAPEPPSPPLALSSLLESLLFVAGEPVAPADLARALALPEAEIQEGLTKLANWYKAGGRGLRLQFFNNKVQLVTAPAAASAVEAFLNLETITRLSTPALETLAVIAYRQPVTRAQIEAIRGVDCAGVLRSLTQRGLVVETGRQESPGRPILYSVTELFMQYFGLTDLADLPPLDAIEADRLQAAGLAEPNPPPA